MARIPGVEIDELYAKYELHPSLFDVYVEGEFDRDFLNHFLYERGLSSDVSVFTAETFEIPNDFLVAENLDLESNKHRLIGLSILLQRELRDSDTNVSCLVDVDLDRVLNKIRITKNLLYTDHVCLEMYCLNDRTLQKFLTLGCNLAPDRYDNFLLLASAILPVQFCLRAINEMLGLNSSVPEFQGGLARKRVFPSFDKNKYIGRYIAIGNLHARSDEIFREFDILFKTLPGDLRDKSHGHDFISLLFEYVSSCGTLQLHDKEKGVMNHGNRLLASALDGALLFADGLFYKIERAARGGVFLWAKS